LCKQREGEREVEIKILHGILKRIKLHQILVPSVRGHITYVVANVLGLQIAKSNLKFVFVNPSQD